MTGLRVLTRDICRAQDWGCKFAVARDHRVEKAFCIQLLRCMLSYDPLQRPTADEVFGSDWVVKWAMNDFERSCSREEK
ncbi:hypothetical protein LMH87_003204 [Akanthomyces muscarius]|uniref:Protein kinase domain-containing protein n=1 Tax=Akanthomyces muscarius TaxID=2231603 RepID=A0A9W8UGU0_AKAMU|nr:hypothetical protein LMH87_003204 [Akanthomyces muscarius]KAJ4144314.1 hypothetical protein LMH87_003204 [Akanthomyces muscarius]